LTEAVDVTIMNLIFCREEAIQLHIVRMKRPGDAALGGGAEGAAKTLRHKGPVLDETPESELAPKRQSVPAENLSG
jgi:hypothetical protein